MSQEVGQTELKAKTQQLLDGPLKHIRAAAIAAALLPLASVAATPASAAGVCASGGVCGTLFKDANNNGIQDSGEPILSTTSVSLVDGNGTTIATIEPNLDGTFEFGPLPPGTYTVAVLIPSGMQVNTSGEVNAGFSVASATLETANLTAINFGFVTSAAANPGTGTPGYWKNHPDAWPVNASGQPVTIMIGGVPYEKDAALAGLAKITKDKTTTMFSSLLSAKLNLLIGNDGSCLASLNGDTIAKADAWMADHYLGSNVLGSSVAWKIGEPYHQTLDAYNNGLLCAPHRK
jgi:hypothetical protein